VNDALVLKNVSASYGRVVALRDVSLTVARGSMVAVVGSNGAGKTTLLRVAAGLLKSTAGTIYVGSTLTVGLAAHQVARSGLCLVPEGRGIFRDLSVQENLTLQAGGRKHAADAVERVARVFPVLAERLAQKAGTLSGGEQQMLALGRALLSPSPIVLADELSLGLSPLMVEQVFRALEVIRSEGRAVLVVEQFVHRVLQSADYVVVLRDGATAFSGVTAGVNGSDLVRHYIGDSTTEPEE
jgi:branched-chain amino acid transport system ATP-binding protein